MKLKFRETKLNARSMEHLDLTKYEKILSRERKEKKEIKLFIDRYDNDNEN